MTGALGALAVGAVGLGAFAQATTGMGFSLVAAPALIAALGPHRGVPAVLLLAVLASLLPLSRDWRHARRRDTGRLLLPALLGAPLAGWLLGRLDTRILAVAAGCGVLVEAAPCSPPGCAPRSCAAPPEPGSAASAAPAST